MDKIWQVSKSDSRNQSGVRFESPKFRQANSLDEIVSAIETSEVIDLIDFSFGNELRLATEGIPEVDRRSGLFLAAIATGVQFGSFNERQTPWVLKALPGEIFQNTRYDIRIDDNVRPTVLKYIPVVKNPLFRFRLQLISFPEVATHNKRKVVLEIYASATDAARHLFRYADYLPNDCAVNTLQVAAYFASKYPGMFTDLEDLFCTIQYALNQGSPNSVIKWKLAQLLLHFMKHSKWGECLKQHQIIGQLIAELNSAWVLAGLNLNYDKLEPIRDLLMAVYSALGMETRATEMWEQTKDILEICAEKNPGAVASGIFARLLFKGKSRLKSEDRKDLIKLKRAAIKVIVGAMKPAPVLGWSAGDYRNIVDGILKHGRTEKALIELLVMLYIPDDETVENHLSNQALISPLLGRLGIGRIVGDREDGGTETDPQFRQKEFRLLYMAVFMNEVVHPIFTELGRNSDFFLEILKGSLGWLDAHAIQCQRAVDGYVANDPMQFLFYGISYFEGFLGRSLDAAGVYIDAEKEGGAVQHRSLLAALLDNLEVVDLPVREIEMFKLVLIEGNAGWNFRNLSYHGIAEDVSFDNLKATAVLYILLKVAAVFRVKPL